MSRQPTGGASSHRDPAYPARNPPGRDAPGRDAPDAVDREVAERDAVDPNRKADTVREARDEPTD